jgi:hypothetical protein
VIAYASRTGTGANLDALRAASWRILVSAKGAHRTEGFQYGIDNGAWTAHQNGKPFDDEAFVRVVKYLGADADFVVAPDVVCGGEGSLAMSLHWLPWLRGRTRRILIPVQDGMTDDDLAPFLSPEVGIFIGGSDDWKEYSAGRWARLAHEHGAVCHMGRVNTKRRIQICAIGGVDSFDGSNLSRYSKNAPLLTGANRQPALTPGLLGSDFSPRAWQRPVPRAPPDRSAQLPLLGVPDARDP